MSTLPIITVNGQKISLTETGGESRGGKKLCQAEFQTADGSKFYIKGYLSGGSEVKNVTAEVAVFDSKKGKVVKTKTEAKAEETSAMSTMVENMVAAALAKALGKV